MDWIGWAKPILDAVSAQVIAGMGEIVKGAVSAAIVSLLAQQAVEWLWGPVADAVAGQARTGFRGSINTPVMRRRVAMLIGVLAVMVAHASNIVDFGPGPKGHMAAAFFGFIGGGFAAPLGEWAKTKWFIPTREAAKP
jgi:hypothetical protein